MREMYPTEACRLCTLEALYSGPTLSEQGTPTTTSTKQTSKTPAVREKEKKERGKLEQKKRKKSRRKGTDEARRAKKTRVGNCSGGRDWRVRIGLGGTEVCYSVHSFDFACILMLLGSIILIRCIVWQYHNTVLSVLCIRTMMSDPEAPKRCLRL